MEHIQTQVLILGPCLCMLHLRGINNHKLHGYLHRHIGHRFPLHLFHNAERGPHMRPHPDTGCYMGRISLSNILTTSNTVRCLHPRCKLGSHPLILGRLNLWSANSHLRMSSLLVARQGVHRHPSQDRHP